MSSDEHEEPMSEDDREELEQTRREMLEDEERAPSQKRTIPSIKFSDVKSCYEKGEWGTISDEMRTLYVRLLRRCANSATFASVETQETARSILSALGLPLESERAQKLKNSEPLPPVVAGWVAKSRRKLVDRQKKLMLERLNKLLAEGITTITEPGPYQEQAIAELIESGEVVLIRDSDVQLRTGAMPQGETKRRKRRVVMIGLPFNEAKYREELKGPKPKLPKQTAKGISYPPDPTVWPDAPPPAPPAEDEDDLI